MKKIITFLLTMSMVFSLAACGQASSDNSEGKQGGGREKRTHINCLGMGLKHLIYMQWKKLKRFIKKKIPDFKLNIVEVSWDDMQTQLGNYIIFWKL